MFQAEAPQYRALAQIVGNANRKTLLENPSLERRLRDANELGRLDIERHSAIRLGTAGELSTIRRLFAVMGMVAVGYYDLSVAGIPVHSTAFRPVTAKELEENPFRIFTSLMRLDSIEDADLRREAASILARRQIVTPRCLALIEAYEQKGGLDEEDARVFVSEAIETFRWHSEATVSAETYRKLRAAHPVIADVVCFKGPHINHLALHTLDIDAAQLAMAELGPKATIEGPPRRDCAILLRQTSFKAIEEPIVFEEADGAFSRGIHAARFGEIEQRGIALTNKGRALYDRLLAAVNITVSTASDSPGANEYARELARQFKSFPDEFATLRKENLAFFRYLPTARGLSRAHDATLPCGIDDLLAAGYVCVEPIVYEDFLPVSAAGIFRSNLGRLDRSSSLQPANRRAFEEALGATVIDELALYEGIEARSLTETRKALGLKA